MDLKDREDNSQTAALIDTLQTELMEQSRLLGMSGEREAALLSKLKQCEKKIAATEALLAQYKKALAEVADGSVGRI